MKTRILSSTLVLLFAVASTAFASETVHHGSTASSHENNATQGIAVENIDFSTAATVSMENWMNSLDNWEQEGQAPETDVMENTVNFQDWMNALDNWERGEEPAISENHSGQASILNEWITSTENWEQR